MALELIASAKEEVLAVLSTANTFNRQIKLGSLQMMSDNARSGVRGRLIVPASTPDERGFIERSMANYPCIGFRIIDSALYGNMTILVVDREKSMIFELVDDSTDDSIKAIRNATYFESRPIALSYADIISSLWRQGEISDIYARANDQLEANERLQREFINIAAHELRTPMQPILGIGNLVQERLNGSGAVKISSSEAAIIVRNAERLDSLVSDLLEVAQLEAGSLKLVKERHDLTKLILKTVEKVGAEIGQDMYARVAVEFESRSASEPIYVNVDRARITKVLSSLLHNAVKYSKIDGGSRVSVSIGEEAGGRVSIRVTDTGNGISREMIPKLFTKFVSSRPMEYDASTGSGLALYIAQKIIKDHGGKIWVENNPEKGSTFFFTLPIERKS